MMGTEMVPETLVIFNQLASLIAGEYFINFSRRESFVDVIVLAATIACVYHQTIISLLDFR
jgi:hypothetical protein